MRCFTSRESNNRFLATEYCRKYRTKNYLHGASVRLLAAADVLSFGADDVSAASGGLCKG